MKLRIFHQSQIFPLLLLVVGGGALAICLSWPDPAAFQQISSKVWPTAIAITLMALSVAIFWENLQTDREGGIVAEAPVDAEDDDTTAGIQGWIFAAGVVAAALLLEILGFWVVLTLLLLLVGWMIEDPERRLRAIIAALIMPGAVFFLFTRVFSQYLPLGLMEFLPSWLTG